MKVKLLKDLPDVKAGAEFTHDPKTDQFVHAYTTRFQPSTMAFGREVVGNNPDFFEELKGGETK